MRASATAVNMLYMPIPAIWFTNFKSSISVNFGGTESESEAIIGQQFRHIFPGTSATPSKQCVFDLQGHGKTQVRAGMFSGVPSGLASPFTSMAFLNATVSHRFTYDCERVFMRVYLRGCLRVYLRRSLRGWQRTSPRGWQRTSQLTGVPTSLRACQQTCLRACQRACLRACLRAPAYEPACAPEGQLWTAGGSCFRR